MIGFNEAVGLGLVQGITEFLPISSSGHLILVSEWLGWPDQGLAFDVAVHLGTLVAVLIYFRRRALEILCGWYQQVIGGRVTSAGRLGWPEASGWDSQIASGLAGGARDRTSVDRWRLVESCHRKFAP